MAGLIVAAVLVLFALFLAARTVRVIPQARAGVVERFGRYSRTLEPGLTIVMPFVDRVRPLIDLREQVVTFPPQPVITEDNVSVGIDTVLYFTITDPKSASYEVANPLQAIEQLTVTSLRNIVGDLTLEETLTSRDQVNTRLRLVLDERTGKWGIRINGVEIKSIDPPSSIQEAMEKQMRAERDRRATILTAEGVKQAQILTAEGEKQSAVLKAQGAREAAILRAEGEAKAIDTVFRAIHAGDPDPKLLSYQYLQMLPELAKGEANKIWVIPSEFTQALSGLSGAMGRLGESAGSGAAAPSPAAGPSANDHRQSETTDAEDAARRAPLGRCRLGHPGAVGRLVASSPAAGAARCSAAARRRPSCALSGHAARGAHAQTATASATIRPSACCSAPLASTAAVASASRRARRPRRGSTATDAETSLPPPASARSSYATSSATGPSADSASPPSSAWWTSTSKPTRWPARRPLTRARLPCDRRGCVRSST